MIEETTVLATTGVDAGVFLGNAICFVIGILVGWVIARAYTKKIETATKDE